MPNDVFTPSDNEMAMIHEEIRKIESGNNVKVLFAVESGSRSWGFASKDSDYDVRFVYKRPIYDYLRLDKRTDTLEWYPDPLLDMVGWDVSKYLSLLSKSNPSAMEWLGCPRYVVSDPYKLSAIEELAETCYRQHSLAHHYLEMAKENANEFLRIADGVTRDEPPKTKKYLYVVRALLSGRYVCDFGKVPPIAFSELLDAYRGQLNEFGVMEDIEDLVKRKNAGLETDVTERIYAIDDWAKTILCTLERSVSKLEHVPYQGMDEANELFIRIITT